MTLTVPKVHRQNTLELRDKNQVAISTLKSANFLAPRRPETFGSNETTEQRCRNLLHRVSPPDCNRRN